jgi:hypothetical protein
MLVRGPWRISMRAAAVTVGIVVPLLSAAAVGANLPGPPPLPGLPQSGQPVTILVEPPSLFIATVPPPPDGCVIAISYDNTQTHPAGTIFRGQTACGNQVFMPVMAGQALLKDTFSNVVAYGNEFGPMTGSGPDTSQGDYSMGGSGGVTNGGSGGSGPVPGLDYTVKFTSSITLPFQTWGPPAQGCSVDGQTLECVTTTTYMYLPGTKGGWAP